MVANTLTTLSTDGAPGPRINAEVFTGSPGKYVSLKETIRGFKMIVDGECDALPEQAFYMVGGIDEVFEKAKKVQ